VPVPDREPIPGSLLKQPDKHKLASVHKDLRLGHLCKELAIGRCTSAAGAVSELPAETDH
jgi:hypothetical protein